MLRAKFSDCQQCSNKCLACFTNVRILWSLNFYFAHWANPFLTSSRMLVGLLLDGISCLNGVHHLCNVNLCNCSWEITLEIICWIRFSIERKGLPFILCKKRHLSYQNFMPLWFKDNIEFPRLSHLDVHQCLDI